MKHNIPHSETKLTHTSEAKLPISNGVTVKLKRVVDDSYEIRVERELLKRMPAILKRSFPASTYVIIADRTAGKLFGRALKTRLSRGGFNTTLIEIPDGEESKSRNTKAEIETKMLKMKCDRQTLILALGGGVVGDIAGFVAANYMRGIRYIQIPTTILAMVDSAIGGKTGINTSEGKNTIGAFHQPKAVFADTACLDSLPVSELKNGLVEAVKIFMTSDRKSFAYAEKNIRRALLKDPVVLKEIIVRATLIKARVVGADEKESGLRTILNFGHTIGHALEKLYSYTVPHGRAVALGILVEAKAAEIMGILSEREYASIRNILVDGLGIDSSALRKQSSKSIVLAARGDKKSSEGKPHYVVLRKLGQVLQKNDTYAHPIPDATIIKALQALH